MQPSDAGSRLPAGNPWKLSLRARQAAGKVRRFFRASLYTRRNDALLALREGECTRCGACCKILFRCPFLIEKPDNPPGEVYSCGIYEKRFNQCRLYPLVPRDLLEVEEACGYTFKTPQ